MTPEQVETYINKIEKERDEAITRAEQAEAAVQDYIAYQHLNQNFKELWIDLHKNLAKANGKIHRWKIAIMTFGKYLDNIDTGKSRAVVAMQDGNLDALEIALGIK